jgi:choline dehydrogenase-like flavoprotein
VQKWFRQREHAGSDRVAPDESGTVCMGSDPKSSALNKYCQAHDVKNLFVTDAAAFVTSPDKNPTLSILALSWRAAEYLLEQAKKWNL